MRPVVLVVVLAMAVVTYATRIGGVWAGRGPLRRALASERAQRWLGHLPGGVLVSIVAPMIAHGGVADATAAAFALIVAARTRNAAATIVVGTLAAALLRRTLGG